MRHKIYVGLAIFLWSTSSLVVVNFKGFLRPFQCASAVVLIATVFVCVFFLIKEKGFYKEFMNMGINNILKISLVGFFGIFLYPIFYFNGLHSTQPVEANVVNYFWPMAGVFFGMMLRVEKWSLKMVTSVFLGFLGASITVLYFKPLTEAKDLISWKFDFAAYFFALFGALSFGFYSALLKKIKFLNNAKKPISVNHRFVIFLVSSSLLHFLFNLVALASGFDFVVTKGFDLQGLVYLVIYSVFNFSIAYLAWAYSVEKMSLYNASMSAFFIPILSTLILSYFGGLTLHESVIFGLLFVLTGIYIQQDHKNYITPLIGFFLGLILLGGLVFVVPRLRSNDLESIWSILGLLIGVFAILSSFILSRVIKGYREERLLFLRIEEHLFCACEILFKAKSGIILGSIDDYMNFLISRNSNFNKLEFNEVRELKVENEEKLNGIIYHLENSNIDAESKVYIKQKIQNARLDSNTWIYMLSEKVSVFEWIILVSLSISMIITFYLIRPYGIVFEIIAIVFSISLILMLLAIKDYDLRKPRAKIEQVLLTQRIAGLVGKRPYIPIDLFEDLLIAKSLVGGVNEFHVRTMNSKGFYRNKTVNPTKNYFKIFTLFFFLAVVSLLAYAIWSMSIFDN